MSAWVQWAGMRPVRGEGELWTARMLRRVAETGRWLMRREAVARLQGKNRRLQVQETVQLGEKRVVAILRVDGEQFLIGSSAAGVQLLTKLEKPEGSESFGAVLASARGAECA